MNAIQFYASLELGLVYGLIALGVYLTFRVIDFPDLTVDGSFPLGAAVAMTLISHGIEPILATSLAFIAGCIAGFVTAYLNVRWKILGLLAGILTMTALYSINLRIMGVPNIALNNEPTLFTDRSVLLVLLAIVGSVFSFLAYFFKTHLGLAIRAAGENIRVSQAYGIRVKHMKLITLSLSNAIIALAGALFAQAQGFADISMGTGTIVVGLSSIIIGEALLGHKGLMACLFGCILGSVIYRCIIAVALNSNISYFKATDLNLIAALLIVIIMVITRKNRKES